MNNKRKMKKITTGFIALSNGLNLFKIRKIFL